MSLSPFYEDSEIITQLRGFFDVEEQWVIDFEAQLSHVEDYDDETYSLQIKDKNFLIHKIHGDIVVVE